MEVPLSTHSVWKEILSGRKDINFEFFPTKMTIGRLQIQIKNNSVDLEDGINELRNIFSENKNLPKVQNDLQKLFG